MNILIENTTTIEYWTPLGNWTKNPEGGKTFPATISAVRTAKQLGIGKFNIVGHIPETDQFINLSHGVGKGTAGDGLVAAEPAV